MSSAGPAAEALGRRATPEQEAAAVGHLQRAERAAARSRRIPEGVTGREIESAAVLGFGTMGRGIAMSFAAAGIPVVVFEASDGAWTRGEAAVAGSLARAVGRGKIEAAEAARQRDRIRRAGRIEDLGDADFLVEAVFEEMAVKKEVFGQLDRVAKPGAVLATNTSSLDVNDIAGATGRPEAVLGTHFFSPAHVMRLLEVVVGDATSAETLATAMRLGVRLGKAPVPVGVCDGFVGNRMLYAYRRQADRLLLEGALPEQVDQALCRFGFRMGPFAVADLAGLDIGQAVRVRLAREAEARGAPPPPPNVVDRLCETGAGFGQKTGRGFYRYEPGDRRPGPIRRWARSHTGNRPHSGSSAGRWMTRRSSNAASSRSSTKARGSWPRESPSGKVTWMWSGRWATGFPGTAAAPCTGRGARSDWTGSSDRCSGSRAQPPIPN